MAKEIFESQEKMKDFLLTLSKMYNISYSNLLLLKNQRKDVSFILHKEKLKDYGLSVKDAEQPLKVIKRIKSEDKAKFIIDEVYDVSQTNAVKKKDKTYNNEYVETMLKGMCARRGLEFIPNSQIENIENIISDIKENCRAGNPSKYSIDEYAKQTMLEINATVFTICKRLNINTRNYNLKDLCTWGVEKDSRTIKESLKYIQKFTNYFVKDFQIQEKIQKIEKENQEEME